LTGQMYDRVYYRQPIIRVAGIIVDIPDISVNYCDTYRKVSGCAIIISELLL